MKKLQEQTARFEFVQNQYFASVEVSSISHELEDGIFTLTHEANFWISGQDEKWMVKPLLNCTVALSGDHETDLKKICQMAVTEHLIPLIVFNGVHSGLTSAAPNQSLEEIELRAARHIQRHGEMESFIGSGASDLSKTASMYAVAKGFGVKQPIALLARILDATPTAIERRLSRARDLGLLPKLSNRAKSNPNNPKEKK